MPAAPKSQGQRNSSSQLRNVSRDQPVTGLLLFIFKIIWITPETHIRSGRIKSLGAVSTGKIRVIFGKSR